MVVVRVVTRRAVELAMLAHRQLPGNHVRVSQLPVASGQGPVVTEPDGMIVGQVLRQIGGARWDGPLAHDDRIVRGATGHQSQRQCAVVTAQAHLGRPAGLVDPRIRCGALVDPVVRGRHVAVPQRPLARRTVRRVAEDADLLLFQRVDSARPGDTQIMRRADDTLARARSARGHLRVNAGRRYGREDTQDDGSAYHGHGVSNSNTWTR